jgi:uncharacterized protein YdeI (BOF family)
MKRAIITATLLLCSQIALATTDWKCMSDCSQSGYQYGYCKKICTF